MTRIVARPAHRPALAVSQSLSQRLIQQAVKVAFPFLTADISRSAHFNGSQARQAGISETLRLLIDLYAQARRLGNCPFLPVASQVRLPAETLALAREQLTCNAQSQRLDYAALPVRSLGEVYEQLLASDRGERKARGSFYTPQPIADFIVKQTVTPLMENTDSACRVLDPAMGTGHFLLSATRLLATQLLSREQAADRTDDRLRRLMYQVATRCIYGIDLDPLAVQLARASLWLEVGLPDAPWEALNEHLRCGDALVNATAQGWPAFDSIVGNPPYGSPVDLPSRKQLVKHLPQMKHNGDAAVGFVERSSQMLSARGRCGLVLPKPLTYSFAWRELRTFIGRRVEHVVDVSRAWPDVKLEQVIVVFGPDTGGSHYRTSSLSSRGFSRPTRLAWRWAERFGTLPCALDAKERRLLDSLQLADVTVGDIARTWRGLPLQSKLRSAGEVPVLGGRDLARWRVRGTGGFVEAAEIDRLESFRPPKLLFQNIIAHIARPQPHIRLIGTYDAEGRVTLDTVNNLSPREAGWPLEGLLALLHSRLVNWFVYRVIYNSAIRTMHFDQYFLDKIPLPVRFQELMPVLAEHAEAAVQNERAITLIEARLADELREATGDRLPAKTLAGLLAGRQSRYERWAESHRARAEKLFRRRSDIARHIDCAIDEAYGVGDAEECKEEHLEDLATCMTS